MYRVIILGTGNIAQHLFSAFHSQKEIEIAQVVGRNPKALSFFSSKTKTSSDFNNIEDADIYIIAVNDDAIATVSQYLKYKKGIIAHTSGSVPMKDLQSNGNRGVFYPLQTFTKGQKIDFKSIPVCIESEKENSKVILKELASLVSDAVYEVSSAKRKEMHLAAVFVNNFTNHMYSIGADICKNANLSFDILKSLIKETANKAMSVNPEDAQTGPAKRNDTRTIKTHLDLIEDPKHQEIYALLSDVIKKKYGKKL